MNGSAPSEQRMALLVEQLRQYPGLAGQLPATEAAIVNDALAGQDIHAIAHNHSISEAAAWATLGNAARLAGGALPTQPVETGGLGADTDPGVTGGYGDTGFGSLGNEPPIVDPDEPPAAAPPGAPRWRPGNDSAGEPNSPARIRSLHVGVWSRDLTSPGAGLVAPALDELLEPLEVVRDLAFRHPQRVADRLDRVIGLEL